MDTHISSLQYVFLNRSQRNNRSSLTVPSSWLSWSSLYDRAASHGEGGFWIPIPTPRGSVRATSVPQPLCRLKQARGCQLCRHPSSAHAGYRSNRSDFYLPILQG